MIAKLSTVGIDPLRPEVTVNEIALRIRKQPDQPSKCTSQTTCYTLEIRIKILSKRPLAS